MQSHTLHAVFLGELYPFRFERRLDCRQSSDGRLS